MKVVIELDRTFVWQPERFDERRHIGRRYVEVNEQLLSKYHEISELFWTIQNQLEHAYRHQEKLTPYMDSPYMTDEQRKQRTGE